MTATIYYDQDANPALLQDKTVAVIGYGSQGHAHALNLQDSGVSVVVGLREGSGSWSRAEEAGLRVMPIAQAAQTADIVMMLIPDPAQPRVYEEAVAPHLTPGKTLMFAHGFNIRYGQITPPDSVDVSMVAPKAPGHRVRALYREGQGTPALLAVHQDASGQARETALAYAWGLSVLMLTAGRVVVGSVQKATQARGIGADRVLIVGTGEVGRMILQKIIQQPELGYRVVGFIGTNGNPRTVMGMPVLGRPADIPRVVDEQKVDEVIIALPEASHQEIVNLVALCEREKVGIKVFPDVFQIMASEISIGDLGGLPLLTVRDVAMRGWRLAAKRLMDIVGATVGLILLSPLMILTAIAIKLESPGPVFYVQERMGLDARPFKMLKFRSMYVDAEKDGPGWTRPGDPRVTRVGRIIRKYSIDELPQLINVLMGDMSLVGPRPERPVYVEQFRQSIPRYMERHREKAGLTGWAQIHGLRGDTSIAERTKYDLWYIENWSLWLDIKIIIRTIFRIFRDRNAY